jgi:adenine phosphoribosyltransferase
LTEGIVDHLTSHILSNHEPSRISSIVCLEARGFFLGPLLASRLSLPCIPIRKRGKLPGEIISTSYEKDYGPDTFEIKTDSFEGIDTAGKGIILVDDLLATGGSVKAAKELLEKLGMEVLEAIFVFDIDVGNYNSEVEGKLGGLKRHAMITLTEKNIGTPVN